MSDDLSPKAKLFLSIGISVVLLFIILLFYFNSEKNFTQLSYSDFKFYSFAGNQIKENSFQNNEMGYIYLYNVTGFKRAYDGKIYLSVIVRILDRDGTPRKSKKLILAMYSDYSGSKIPRVKVIFDFKGMMPGQYTLQVSLYDQIANRMFTKDVPILISGVRRR